MNDMRIRKYVQLTGLEPILEMIPGLEDPAWCGRSKDCLLNASIALCSLINLLLISFCSCLRSSSYHQAGRPYSQTRPRLKHSLHLGASMSHLTFLNEQVQHPSGRFSVSKFDLGDKLAYLYCFWEHQCYIQHSALCFVSGKAELFSMGCEKVDDLLDKPPEPTVGHAKDLKKVRNGGFYQ